MTLGVNDYQCLGYGYPCKQCTSFVFWRIRHDLGHADFTPSYKGAWFGNAYTWYAAALRAGLPIDPSPKRGDVAVFPPYTEGALGYGHLAVVLSETPNADGTIEVEDYNARGDLTYHQHNVQPRQLHFIHFLAAAPSGVTYVAFAGTVQVPVANVRSGPGTSYALLRTLRQGTHVGFDGYCYAQPIYDPVAGQYDHRWYELDEAHGHGWIASALVDGNAPGSHP